MSADKIDRWVGIVNKLGVSTCLVFLFVFWAKPLSERFLDEHLALVRETKAAVVEVSKAAALQTQLMEAMGKRLDALRVPEARKPVSEESNDNP